jgi:hypothetical protein
MGTFKLLLDFYIFFSVVVLAIASIIFLATKKFNKDRIKMLGFFLDLDKSQSILLAGITLNLIVSTYCILKIENFSIIYVAMIIGSCVISLISSLNLHYAIAEIIYDAITIVVLVLLNLIKSYLLEVHFDAMINILCIVFSIGIFVYLMYVTTRKIELLFRKA